MVQPSGVEPESRPSEGRALSNWTMAGQTGGPLASRTPISRFVALCLLQLDEGAVKTLVAGDGLEPSASTFRELRSAAELTGYGRESGTRTQVATFKGLRPCR
jgi:hypothetical protein